MVLLTILHKYTGAANIKKIRKIGLLEYWCCLFAFHYLYVETYAQKF
jgi:hypothetical protein